MAGAQSMPTAEAVAARDPGQCLRTDPLTLQLSHGDPLRDFVGTMTEAIDFMGQDRDAGASRERLPQR